MTTPADITFGNRILDRLDPVDRELVRAHLIRVHHPPADVIFEAFSQIEYVYFPTTCVVSAVTLMLDGSMIEVASTGSEGLVGHAVAMRDRFSVNRLIVQIPGDSLHMSVDSFHKVLSHSSSMLETIARYNSAFNLQVSRSVACNGVHKLEMRCCRWLLMIRDSIHSNVIPITHEFLSCILGVRRSSVTDVLAPLQAAGLLSMERGVITLLDLAGLESHACECYKIVRDGYLRLMKPE